MKSKQVQHIENYLPLNMPYPDLVIFSKNKSIQVNIDDSSACQILTVGSSKSSLKIL